MASAALTTPDLRAATTSSSLASTNKPGSQPSSSKRFWPRCLTFTASPHPSQLAGGRQLDAAPMCPCLDCWEHGSHTHPPKTPKAPKIPKTQPPTREAVFTEKKSPFDFLQRRTSKDSLASDMHPLRQPNNVATEVDSVCSRD